MGWGCSRVMQDLVNGTFSCVGTGLVVKVVQPFRGSDECSLDVAVFHVLGEGL